MAKPRRRPGLALHQFTLAGLVVIGIWVGGSVTASMLAAQAAPQATPDRPTGVGTPTAPPTTAPITAPPLLSLDPDIDDTSQTPPEMLSAPETFGPDGPATVEPPSPPTPEPIDHGNAQLRRDLEGRAAPPPLPTCITGDRRAPSRRLDEWRTTLLDRRYGLPQTYVPEKLVSVRRAGFNADAGVRPEVIDDLSLMRGAARAAGAPIAVQSGYRSYRNQATVFSMWRGHLGREAISASARAGHSEHQLGTSLDFRSAGSHQDPWDHRDWGTTLAGRWLAHDSWRYGFVLSYPRGQEAMTCYGYEPWHFRYVGRDIARAVHESGTTLREYLWDHHGSMP